MATYNDFLLELTEYPQSWQIDEASNSAQDKATEYALSIDEHATLTVEDGDVYVKSDLLNEEQQLNVQAIFDEEFSDKILSFGFHD